MHQPERDHRTHRARRARRASIALPRLAGAWPDVILFEVISAFDICGLSTEFSAERSAPGTRIAAANRPSRFGYSEERPIIGRYSQ